MYGDFEDLETGEVHKAKSETGAEAEVQHSFMSSFFAILVVLVLCVCVCV